MRFLRRFFRFVFVGFLRKIVLAVIFLNKLPDLRERLFRNVHRIGTHIRDKTRGLAVAHIDPFIKLLGQHHSSVGVEP